MLDGIIFILKAIILTEALTNAVKNWGILEPIRNKVKSFKLWVDENGDSFFGRLLGCFECSSVWVSFFVIFYLLYFEWSYFTYVIIAQRLACFIQVGYQLLDATRAVKEKQI